MTTPLRHETGDVIMFANDANCIGRLIQEVDASPYSHAGIAIGPDELADMSSLGSTTSRISEFTNDTQLYHLISSHGAAVSPERLQAVTDEARRLVELELDYGRTQVALAGLLLLTRRIPGAVRPLAGIVLWGLAKIVEQVADPRGRTMVCSDFVYRCYDAGGIDLLPDGIPELPHPDEPTLDEWLGPAGPRNGVVEPPPMLEGWFDGDELMMRMCEAIERRRRSGPADLQERDPDLIEDVRAARAAALHELRRLAGPSPDGVAVPDFVSPGDLLRGGVVVERDRWRR